MNKKACLFVRVSTDKQNHERQISDLSRYADQRGYAVVDTITEQISGALDNDKRPGLQKLLAAANAGKFNRVLVTELSRLGRNAYQVQTLIHQLSGLGISVGIQTLGIETLDDNGRESPMGGIMVAIMAQLSQMERQNLIERINSGLARAKANGKRLGRPDGSRESADKVLQKHASLAKDIRAGISVRKVAKIHSTSTATVLKVKRLCESSQQQTSMR